MGVSQTEEKASCSGGSNSGAAEVDFKFTIVPKVVE